MTELEELTVAAARAVAPDVDVIEIDPSLADTADFCATYGYSLQESANCLLVVAKTGERRYAACLVQATRRLDLNRHARDLVGARKASFAKPEDAVEVTGMVPGGVTPFGLPEEIEVVIDAPIMDLERVIVGGGGRGVKLYLPPAGLAALPGARIAAISRG